MGAEPPAPTRLAADSCQRGEALPPREISRSLNSYAHRDSPAIRGKRRDTIPSACEAANRGDPRISPKSNDIGYNEMQMDPHSMD